MNYAVNQSVGGGLSWILSILNNLIFWFQAIIFILAVVMALYAAYLFITAAGNATKIGDAIKILVWSAVGVAVALLAFGIVPLVQSLVGSTASQFQYQYYQQQYQYQQPYRTP